MTQYILDADWSIQALAQRGVAASTIARLAEQRIGISVVTLGEIYEGAHNSSNPGLRLDEMRRFLDPFAVIPVTDPIMRKFAEIRAHLRRQGLLIPDFDLIIGATALIHDLTVLTFNRRHFSRIPALRLYDPT